MMRCNLSCWFNVLSIKLKRTKQHKKSILFPLQLIVMLLLAMPSSSFRQPHSLVCLFDCWLDWLLCLYSIPSGRDSCHHLLCFRPFLPPTSRLIVAFMRFVLVFVAFLSHVLPSGGDSFIRVIICPLVAGLCCDRDHYGWIAAHDTTTGIPDGVGGDWADIWRLLAMVGVVGVKTARKECWVQKS